MSAEIIEPVIGSSDTSAVTPQDIFSGNSFDTLSNIEIRASQFAQKFISGLKAPFESPSSVTSSTRISGNVNPNLVIASGATVGTTALVYTTLTNPGVQQTAQSYAGAAQNISKAFQVTAQTTQSVLTSQYAPILLIGGLILVGVVLLKK